MKRALVEGQLALAVPDAPAMAVCPHCGGDVELRSRQGTYFWRHVQLPRGGCQPPPEPAPGEDKVRRVDDLVVELCLDDAEAGGHCLKLRQGEAGEAEVVIALAEARPLAEALEELAGLGDVNP